MIARIGSLFLVVLAFSAAIVCGARLLRAALLQHPIHAAGYWRTESGALEPWQVDLRLDGDSLTGEFSGERNGQLIRGTAAGTSERDSITLVLRSEAGEPLATVIGRVDGATLSGAIEAADANSSDAQTGQWNGGWYADAPQIDAEPLPTPIAGPTPISQPLVRKRSGSRAAGSAMECSDRLVNSSAPVATQNEPEIAVDRMVNPDRIVAAAIDYSLSGGPRVFWYFSSDGGNSWPPTPQRGPIPMPTPANKSADPSVDYDANGNPYIGALAYKNDEGPDDMDAIIVARSLDNGATFPSFTTVVSTVASTGAGLDKPWLAVDRSPSSPYQNRVHVVWTEVFDTGSGINTAIRLATSSDNGQSFPVNPTTIATASTTDQGRVVAYPIVATAPDGTVYVLWLSVIQNGNPSLMQSLIVVRRCQSGGTTCEPGNHQVAEMNTLPDNLPGAHFTTANIPAMAVDAYPYPQSPAEGFLYVVWNEYRKDLPVGSQNSDIFFSRSINGGIDWSPKAAVVSEAYDEFFPAVSVDNSHFVRVVFYKRIDFISNAFNVYEVTSGSAGINFGAPSKINCGVPINPLNSDPGIGDYIANDSAFSRHHIWMDMRNAPGNQDIYMTTTSGC